MIKRLSFISDLQMFLKVIRAHIASRGNVKARGKPEPEIENSRKVC
ncbi:MAG: hypothetical protein O7E52_08995 [Candidatus Poribacteria bacterium]|nr:hypothetical protein [Candidatus Poribacteria bacterium]